MRVPFRIYRRIYRNDRWMRRHFSLTGHLLLTFTLAAAVFGVDTKASSTYQLFVFLAALLLYALLSAPFVRCRIAAMRELPRYGTVGEPLRYTATLHNLDTRAQDGLTFIDLLREDYPAAKEVQAHRARRGRRAARLISYRDWLACLVWRRGGTIEEVPLPRLDREALSVKLQFTPLRRGRVHFDACCIAKTEPLGLFRRLTRIERPQSCLILPKYYPIKFLQLPGARRYQPGGVSFANALGESAEFMSLRDYRPGDALSAVHWKSYAKYGKLIVKEYQDEYFARAALVLDTFITDASAARFEAAVSVAASLVFGGERNDLLLDLVFIDREAYCFTAGRGVDQSLHLQEILADVQPERSAPFARLKQSVLAHAARCNAVLCVLLCWDEERRALLKQLQALGLTVYAFVLHDGELAEAVLPDAPPQCFRIDVRRVGEDLAAL
ncbi:MAG: DUF58 domain-containing protein [Gammaproteobacteria bacterium]